MPTYGLALGSNLGDCRANLEKARRLIGGVSKSAPLYQSSPVDCPEGSPIFINTVIETTSDLPPETLLAETQHIELSLGRESHATRATNAPRPVDIDLLYADNIQLNVPSLTLPHPRLHLRRFVLQPLTDLRPDLVLPGFTETTKELLAKLRSTEPPLTLISKKW